MATLFHIALSLIILILGGALIATLLHIKAVQQRLSQTYDSQQEMLKAARLEALSSKQAKSKFLGAMSHELRTPLSAIIGYADLLLEESIPAGAPPECRKALSNIKASSFHLLNLIDDILALARIDAGHEEVSKKEISLRLFVEELYQAFLPIATKKGVSLTLHPSPSLPEAIWGDRDKIKKILSNLMDNAVKFTPREKSVDFTIEPKGSSLLFSVSDKGPGLTPAEQKKIFHYFEQMEEGPSHLKEGTGLGLAIAQELAAVIGGKVWAESEKGKGSTFFLEIPLARWPDRV